MDNLIGVILGKTGRRLIFFFLIYEDVDFFFRFLNNKFEESYTPTIEDFHRKLYRIRGEVHQLDILDTSGNHPFPAMRKLSFLTGKTRHNIINFIICYVQ